MNPSDSSPPAPRPEPLTLSSLWLAGAKEMDAAAWNRLVNTFGPIVYRWCRTSGVSEADSPDVVQEVFTAVARGIGNFQRVKEEGSFRSWLATITRNKIRDYFRKRAERDVARGGTDALAFLEQQAEQLESTVCPAGIQSPLVRQVLQQVRAEFESTTWEAFWLTTIERKPAAEVAMCVGISTDSVYQSKSRVLRRLRKALSEVPG